jgi:hypothetical protein
VGNSEQTGDYSVYRKSRIVEFNEVLQYMFSFIPDILDPPRNLLTDLQIEVQSYKEGITQIYLSWGVM